MYDAFASAMAADSTDIRVMFGKVAQRPETRVAHRSPRQGDLCRFGVHRLE
jgi:hypothetical protein